MTEVISARNVVAEGHSLRVYESGNHKATPVLMLHGSGPGVNATANWQGLMTDLASQYYCIAPDVLGFGDSACPDPFPRGLKATVELRARNTLALLDELQLDRVHVVGNSMGGIIALRMAQLAPSRLDKLVFMGSAAEGGLEPGAIAKTFAFLSDPTVESMTDLLHMFVYDEKSLGDDIHELALSRLSAATRPDIARVTAATFDPSAPALEFTPAELAEIQNEALVVHGREDRVLSVERSYYIAAHLPEAQLHVFPHTGHWAHLEQRDRFRVLLESFFSGAI